MENNLKQQYVWCEPVFMYAKHKKRKITILYISILVIIYNDINIYYIN